MTTPGRSCSGTGSIVPSANEIRYRVIPWLPCPGGLLRPRVQFIDERLASDQSSARRSSHGTSAIRPRERHMALFAEIIAAATGYE